MKNITTELKNHLAGEVTSLATCWKLTLTNSNVMGFTDHDNDILFDGVNYLAASGFTPTAVENTSNLSVDNLDMEGVLDSNNIKDNDIIAGLYDFAEVEIFRLNYKDITQGKMILRRGWLGEVKYGKSNFVAEIRGLTQKLSKTIGDLYSPSCRTNLGNLKCGVDLTPFTATGSVTSISSNRIFTDTLRIEANGFYNLGKITFTNGSNEGLSMEVKEFSQFVTTLVMPMPYDIQISDTYSIEAGCDKTFETCKSRFSNVINFRGEPHVPGTDRILQTSNTR